MNILVQVSRFFDTWVTRMARNSSTVMPNAFHTGQSHLSEMEMSLARIWRQVHIAFAYEWLRTRLNQKKGGPFFNAVKFNQAVIDYCTYKEI